jgi:hypothetical protein
MNASVVAFPQVASRGRLLQTALYSLFGLLEIDGLEVHTLEVLETGVLQKDADKGILTGAKGTFGVEFCVVEKLQLKSES